MWTDHERYFTLLSGIHGNVNKPHYQTVTLGLGWFHNSLTTVLFYDIICPDNLFTEFLSTS